MDIIFVDARPAGTHRVLHSSMMLYAMLTASACACSALSEPCRVHDAAVAKLPEVIFVARSLSLRQWHYTSHPTSYSMCKADAPPGTSDARGCGTAPTTAFYNACKADPPSGTRDAFAPHFSSPSKLPQLSPPRPSDFAPRMMANELITAIQRCSIGDREQQQSAAELAAIFVGELMELLVHRPQLQPQVFRQVLPAVQHFLHRTRIISAADTGSILRSANRLLGAAAAFVALGGPCHRLCMPTQTTALE